jgi:ubiquinone/menaquinone biosynthesis C-methylase UbiE
MFNGWWIHMSDDVKAFWDGRAKLGQTACTDDLVAKQLEIEAISKYAKDGINILDLGCGNGITAFEIAKQYHSLVIGVDYSQPLIDKAIEMVYSAPKTKGACAFIKGDLSDPKDPIWSQNQWDMIYTERSIINLPSWEVQKQTIFRIFNILKPGGIYVMCENSADALQRLNKCRTSIGLTPIMQPWHNRYLEDANLKLITYQKYNDVYLNSVDCYSSTYYFLSRVINAWEAERKHEKPSYDAPINKLALNLPPMGDVGQGKIWVFKKMTMEEREYTTYA